MSKGTWVLVVAAAAAVIAGAAVTQNLWHSQGAVAQGPRKGGGRPVPVEVTIAQKKEVPVRFEALGNVTPLASVAIKSRVETTIVGVHFRDGARVNKGDLLFTLDSRQIEAEIKRVQAVIDGAEAQLAQAQRDVERYSELVKKNAATQVTLNNAQTQVNISRATAESNKATLENLKIQLGYCTVRAPIAGRISMANVKIGNFVRPADTTPLATINQMAPIYVSFTVPQKVLPDVRKALAAETATVEAIVPGDNRRAGGAVTMIENTVDPTTGMVTVRATMPNQDDVLWPGTLVTTELTLRVEEAVVVPSNAVEVSQTGSFVFVVRNGVARVQPVTVARTVGQNSVIAKGLNGGETIVTEGQLLLSNGSKVAPRGSKGPPRGRKKAGA